MITDADYLHGICLFHYFHFICFNSQHILVAFSVMSSSIWILDVSVAVDRRLELETLLALLTQNSDEAPTQELHFQLLDDVGHQSNIYKAGVYLQFKDIIIGHSCLWSPQDQDMETLRRKLSVSIKKRIGGERPDNKGREETTTNCNQEFDFVRWTQC